MNGRSASNRRRLTAPAAIFLLAVAACGRLGAPVRPSGVPEGAEQDRKTGLWTYETTTSFIQYFSDGKVAARGSLVQGRREGAWTAWSMDGSVIITTGTYRKGRRDGLWKHFDDRGRLYLTMRYAPKPVRDFGFFFHPDYGNENGAYERFFPDGKIEERGEFRGGFYEGPVVRFQRNGRPAVRGTYRRDLMDGPWTYYYPEGGIERTETYVTGQLNGRLTNYHPDGSVYQVALFRSGNRVRILELHPRSP